MLHLSKKSKVGALPRSRGRPKAEDAGKVEALLLDWALREFLEHGYGGASLSRIIRTARVSKTTLYSRFSGKEQLFRAIMNRQIQTVSANTVLRSSQEAFALADGLRAYGERTLEICLQGELLKVNRLIYSESGRFPELGRAAAERSQRGIRDVANFISACNIAPNFPFVDPLAASETFIFMLRGWYVETLLTNRHVSAGQRQRWVEFAVGTLINGCAVWKSNPVV